MDAFCVESVGDDSSGVYRLDGKIYRLVCVINPRSAMLCNHHWPETASKKDFASWKNRCVVHRVKMAREGSDGTDSTSKTPD